MSHLLNLSLLKHNRDYGLLYSGQFISFIGSMITGVALPFQMYELTHSTLMVGLLSLVQLLPLLFTALLGGVCADRYNRRVLLLSSEFLLTLGCGLLAYNASQAAPSLVFIFIISAFMSAINGLHRPALDSITQQLVDSKDYTTVAALGSFKYSFCMIAGPSIAGLLLAYYGIVLTYLLDLASFGFSLCSIASIRNMPKPVAQVHLPIVASLQEGLKFALKRQELTGSYWVDFIAMVFGMPNALFPAIAQSFGGAQTLGLLYAAPAVGALLISFFSGWTQQIKYQGRAIAIAAALWGLAIVGFGLANSLWFALLFLALAGAFDAISGIFRSAMWNTVIPHEYRGRLAGIEMIGYLSGPKLGNTEAGLVAAAFGITASVVSGGILCVLGVGVCCWYLPKFLNYKP
jgi:MFS family permease